MMGAVCCFCMFGLAVALCTVDLAVKPRTMGFLLSQSTVNT